MELRYVGFDQTQNMRMYRFETVAKGEPPKPFLITADLALFRAHGIQIQEGPALCAIKLASDLENGQSGEHQLTDADFVAHATVRGSAEAVKTKSRSRRANRTVASWRMLDKHLLNTCEGLRRRWKQSDPTLAGVLVAVAIIATLMVVSLIR